MRAYLVGLPLLCCLLAACSDDATSADGGAVPDGPAVLHDAATPDAGQADASKADAAEHDAQQPDHGQPDALSPDTLSPDLPPPTCGDGVINGNDQCEGSQLGGKTCATQGFDHGALGCKGDCTFDTSNCFSVLDPSGIALTSGQTAQEFPRVAWDGKSFLVVWELGYGVVGVRVSPAGAVLDQTPFVIRPTMVGNGESGNPKLACDGTGCLVVWWDSRGSDVDIYGNRVTQAGAVQDGTGFVISSATGDQFNPAVAWDGTRYLVVWDDKRTSSEADIYAARVSKAGAVQDSAGIAVSTATDWQYIPEVAGGSQGFLVAWTDKRTSIKGDIYAARVSGAGNVADPGGLAVAGDTRAEEGARVAWDGTNFMVVWQHDHYPNVWNVRGARVSPGSGVIDTIGIDICTDPLNQKNAALAWDGQRYQVVWSGQKNGPTYDYDIAGARVSTQGQLLPGSKVTVAATPENQLVPAVAAGGGTLLAVWQDKRNGAIKNDIYAARIGQ